MNTATTISESHLFRRLAMLIVLASLSLGLIPSAFAASVIPSSPREANPVVGTPSADFSTFDGQQSYQNCGIKAQEFILEELTGREYDEEAMFQESLRRGWCSEVGGSSPDDIGNYLELEGLEVHRYKNAGILTIAAELAQGHKVIVCLDSSELWLDGPDDDFANHALVVVAIDDRDPLDMKVIVADSGNGEFNAYPLDQFLNAWQDGVGYLDKDNQPVRLYRNYMVTAQIPTANGKVAGQWTFEGNISESYYALEMVLNADGTYQFVELLDNGGTLVERHREAGLFEVIGNTIHMEDHNTGNHYDYEFTFEDGQLLIDFPEYGGEVGFVAP